MRQAILYGLCMAGGGMVMTAPAAAVEVPEEVDTAFRHYVMLPELLLPVLQKAKDKESAEGAAEELQNLLALVYDARRDLNKISALAPDVATELRRRYESEMRAGWGKAFAEIFRLQKARCYGSSAFSTQFNTLCILLEQ